jgi:hypothetical protein
MSRLLLATGLALLLLGCGCESEKLEDYQARIVTLPNGREVRAESMLTPADTQRGMMFRSSLAPDRGMLFFHTRPAKVKYWMFQCLIPLDIVWMDGDRRIVEISANTPPCPAGVQQCPTYGGHYNSLYVLELAGGMAAKYGLKVGDTLRF